MSISASFPGWEDIPIDEDHGEKWDWGGRSSESEFWGVIDAEGSHC